MLRPAHGAAVAVAFLIAQAQQERDAQLRRIRGTGGEEGRVRLEEGRQRGSRPPGRTQRLPAGRMSEDQGEASPAEEADGPQMLTVSRETKD